MLVGAVIDALNRPHPNLRVEVVVAPWKELPARLHAREINLAVADVSEFGADEALEIKALGEHRALLVCCAVHPLTALPGAGPRDVLSYPLEGPSLPAAPVERLLQQCQHRCGRRRASAAR